VETPLAEQITEGDRLRWRFPSTGVADSATVVTIKSTCEEGMSAYVEPMQLVGRPIVGVYLRNIKLDWLTHYNGRRLDQENGSRHEEEKSVDFSNEAGSDQFRFLLGEEPEMATKAKAGKKATTKKAVKPKADTMRTSHRKSLDEMSEAHRAHIEKWEPHLESLRGEGVWGFASRVPGRGALGPCFIALKRGPKDYAVVEYNTEKMTKVTPSKVLEDGIETSTGLLEAFKPYRLQAKEERNAAKSPAKPAPKPKKKAATKPKPKAKASVKKTAKKPTRKAAPKRSAAKK